MRWILSWSMNCLRLWRLSHHLKRKVSAIRLNQGVISSSFLLAFSGAPSAPLWTRSSGSGSRWGLGSDPHLSAWRGCSRSRARPRRRLTGLCSGCGSGRSSLLEAPGTTSRSGLNIQIYEAINNAQYRFTHFLYRVSEDFMKVNLRLFKTFLSPS